MPVPLHRLSADLRGGRSRGRAIARASTRSPRVDGVNERAAMNVIGTPRRRVDGRAKVTGQTRFADDLMLPRMLHCKLLRSTVPHARIAAIDVSRALARPGVHLVLTGADFPIPYGILPVSQDEHALCRRSRPLRRRSGRRRHRPRRADRVRGARPHRRRVRAAAHLRRRPRTASPTPSRASTTTATPATSTRRCRCEFGDVEQAFADADRVFEDTFFYQGNTHLPIEQHAAVAAKDPDGKLVLWSSTQTPHYVHRALAKALAMPAAHIRVIATPNGGGFGGKSDPFNHEIVVAKAALLLDRPVKICLTREEVFYCHRGRHPGADAVQDRRQEGRHDHRHARADAARRRRLRLVRRRQHVLHRRAADRHLPHPDAITSTAAASSPTSRRAGRSAATARRRPLRPGDSARQDRRDAGHRSRRAAPAHRRAARHADRELPARRHHRPGRVHPPRSSKASGWNEHVRQAAATAAASASPARRTSPAPACRSTGTTCRTPACS